MTGRATVLTDGPYKGHSIPSEADTILLARTAYQEQTGPLEMNTDPHKRLEITLFGRYFVVWVPLYVPDDALPEYVASQILNPLGLGLWRDGERTDGRAEEVRDQPIPRETHQQHPEANGVQRKAYRPGRVPEAPGTPRGHHRPGPRSEAV